MIFHGCFLSLRCSQAMCIPKLIVTARELLQVELWEGKLEDARACREQMHQYLVDALHLFPTDAGTFIGL